MRYVGSRDYCIRKLTTLDKLVVVGKINIRKLIGQVSHKIKARGTRIEGLAERVKSIEEELVSMVHRLNNHDRN